MKFLWIFFFLVPATHAAPRFTLAYEYSVEGKVRDSYRAKDFSLSRKHNVQSLSKSILSLLVGIALDQKKMTSLEEDVAPLLWKANSKKFRLSWKDLLTMQSGLPSTSRGNYGRWVGSKDWISYFQRFDQATSRSFSYSTGDSHLLAVALERKLKEKIPTFANRELFHPLGIRNAGWDKDPQGNTFGGNNLELSFLEVKTLGQALLSANPPVKSSYLKQAWSVQATTPEEFVEFSTRGYGFYWWLIEVRKTRGVCALGYGGQFLCLFPERKAQFTIFSRIPKNHSEIREHYQEIQRLLEKLVSIK